MVRHGPCPVARARRDRTAGGRLARAAGPGTATRSLTRNESQSMYFHRGNHGPNGAGPGYIYYVIPPPLARARAPPGAEAAFSLVEKQV